MEKSLISPTAEISSLLPWTSNYFEYKPGLKIHYFDVGPKDKECLLLVHGNPTWSFYFRSLISKFSGSYRVIAADFLGMGLSSKCPDNSWRASDRAQELEALLNHLGIQKFSIVMHDWGGPIGTRVAINRIKDLQRVVYLNTTLTETESLPPFIKLAAKSILSRLITSTTTQFLQFTTRFGTSKKLSKAIKSAYFLPFPTIAARKAICDFVQDIPFSPEHPTYKDLADLAKELPLLKKVPILILWGLKDPVFHRGMFRRVASHFPHAKVKEYTDASHLILEDKPVEVAEEIENFLNSPNDISNQQAKRTENSASSNCLTETFFKTAKENPSFTASVEIKTPGLLSIWPISKLLGTDSDRLKYNMLSYQELKERCLQYQRGLLSLGLTPGKKIIMLVTPGHDFLAFSYAIIASGAVPVFIDPGIGTEKLCECIRNSGAEGAILSSKAQLLYFVKRKLFKHMSILVNASPFAVGVGTNLDFFLNFSAAETTPADRAPDSPAMVAFTSGATGTPKGAVFSHQTLASQLQIFKEHFKLRVGSKDLPLLPIFSLYSCALGAGVVYYPTPSGRPLDLDPEQICKAVNDLQIESSFGSPTLWAKIAGFMQVHAIEINSLKKIFIAGTSVAKSLITTLNNVIPSAQIFTPYGATEALPVTLASQSEITSLSFRAANGMEGIAVGKPLNQVEARVIRIVHGNINSEEQIQDLPAGEIGEIIVKGNNISTTYLNNQNADEANKIKTASGEVWHRIGDACYRDQENNIYYCGRVAHSVENCTKTLFSEPVELIFNRLDKVKRSALIRYNGKAAIAIEPEPKFFPANEQDYNIFLEELKELASQTLYTKDLQDFFFFKLFPVDARHNAKIFRDQLGELASSNKQDYQP